MNSTNFAAEWDAKTNASVDEWKIRIRQALTRDPEGWADENEHFKPSAISLPRRYLVAKVGCFRNGDRAFEQMKRAGELVLSYGFSNKAQWSLASEEEIAKRLRGAKKAAAEQRRQAVRDEQLRELLNGDAYTMMEAMRAAFEAGRRAENKYLD